jgi:MerR family Zn(II)-responsive transcriptional regulator of zntA
VGRVLIGEFARRVGVTADTIRFYEKVGFFSRNRSPNGYRVYGDEDLRVAELIASGKTIGFSLREILAFTEEMQAGALDHGKAQQSLQAKLGLVDAQLAALQNVKELIQRQIAACRQIELDEQQGSLRAG